MSKISEIPWEINSKILSYLENPSDILSFSLISHYHHTLSILLLYKKVNFYSLKQRDSFFEQIIDPSKPTDEILNYESNNDSAVDVSFSSSQSEDSSCAIMNDIQEKISPLTRIRGIDFCLDHPFTRFDWTSHHITNELMSLSLSPLSSQLTTLNIAGAQFRQEFLALLLSKLTQLRYLDLSGSNIRYKGLVAVGNSCKFLETLCLNGLFVLSRIDARVLYILLKDLKLKQLETRRCQDINEEVYDRTRTNHPDLLIIN